MWRHICLPISGVMLRDIHYVLYVLYTMICMYSICMHIYVYMCIHADMLCARIYIICYLCMRVCVRARVCVCVCVCVCVLPNLKGRAAPNFQIHTVARRLTARLVFVATENAHMRKCTPTLHPRAPPSPPSHTQHPVLTRHSREAGVEMTIFDVAASASAI